MLPKIFHYQGLLRALLTGEKDHIHPSSRPAWSTPQPDQWQQEQTLGVANLSAASGGIPTQACAEAPALCLTQVPFCRADKPIL